MKMYLKFLSVVLLISIFTVSCAMAPDLGMNAPMGDAYFGMMGGVEGDLSGEDYTEIVENAFVNAAETPDSYFSIDANTASYPNLRRYLQQGYINIPKDAVRVEEMLNYFDYDYEKPTDGSVLALTSSVFDNPYNPTTKLMTIGLAAQEIEFKDIRNNLVFLIDVSGSMYSEDKLPLVQQSFSMLVENLNPEDRVSIVTYAGSDKVVLKGAFGYEKQKILAAIEDLTAGGSTAGSAGITTAYEIAKECFIEGGNNRVILATDGDFNVGVTGLLDLETFIKHKAQSTGVTFSVFGFGTGNLKADKMETLALNGNGTYGYIDSLTEARRALVEQIGGTLVTVAKDVKAGISFNPEYVEAYRLIGYENKLLTEDEFNDSSTDAGELGSGHTVTVVYEVILTDKALSEGERFADVKIKYKPTENVGGDSETEQEITLGIGTEKYHAEPGESDAFVASVIEFALILRDSEYKGDANINDLIARLDALDLTNDECKDEFKALVKLYKERMDSLERLEAYVVPMVYLGGIESSISPINAYYDKVEGQGSRVPIYRFDSKSEIEEFEKIINENCLWQAENQNNCFSFHEKYDEAFFAENSLVFVYFSATVAYQYGIVDIKYNQDTFCVYIEQTNNPGIVPEVVNGRGTIIEVSKEKLNGIQFFDAFVK